MDYKNRIKDFYEGKLNQQEAREFLDFLESPEAEKQLTQEMIQAWISELKQEDQTWDNGDLWKKINSQREPAPVTTVNKLSSDGIIGKYLWIKVAAMFLFFGLGLIYFLQLSEGSGTEELLVIQDQYITKSNPKGQKTRIQLEDGSEVYLNSESSIRYPADFAANRQIFLEGEAYFKVAEDSLHPFKVDAKEIITTALGTSFNISTFNSEEQVIVTLLTGKVKLNKLGKDEFIELIPGEESILSANAQVLEKYTVSNLDRILWTKGILKFQDASLIEMKKILERWYGVEIIILGNPNNLKASGVFDPQESLENVLKVMGETLEFEFEIHDQLITINFK